tara:strand:- start:113 stop:1402 length:1290 start_codon:yes stop_codon:yes gene_type:complete
MSEADAHSGQNTAVEEADAPDTESIQEDTPEVGNNDLGGSGEVDGQQEAAEQATPSMADRISEAGDIAEYEALMSEIEQNPNLLQELDPNEESSEETATNEEEAQAPPEGEPEQREEQPVEQEQVAEQSQPDEAGDVVDEGDKIPQFRLRPTEQVDAEALRIMKAADAADAPINLEQALSIAKQRLGIEERPTAKIEPVENDTQYSEEEEAEEEDPISDVTYAEAKQELKDLRKKHSQALRDGDLDEAADVMDQLGETEELVELLSVREEQEATAAVNEHDHAFDSSVAKANELYPDFGNEGSDFYARAAEIDAALRDTEDNRYFDANKPLLIAQMVAKELNIAPNTGGPAKEAPQQKQKAAPQQQSPSSPQPPRTEKPGQLPAASGASRTAGVQTGQAATLADQVANISNPDDFDELAEQVFRSGIAD